MNRLSLVRMLLVVLVIAATGPVAMVPAAPSLVEADVARWTICPRHGLATAGGRGRGFLV